VELIRGLHNIRPRHSGCVATIGAFDGVHRGHQAVIQKLKEKSAELGLPSLVITLEPLPREYFAPAQAPARLMSFREKTIALQEQGVDRVLRIRFDQELSEVPAETFIEDIFHRQLGIKYMIVGDDLRFGHERRGDVQLLRRMGAELGFEVSDTETLAIDGERASSTRIRTALENGDFALAERLLGRPYAITGKVVYGKQLGRTLGAPTANLQLHRIKAALSGVYAVDVKLGDEILHGVGNVGTRPTIDHGLTAILEVHLLNFSRDIYGKTLQVAFRKKLRDEKKFGSLDELKAAIHNDIETAQQLFELKP
jgi:riboflavin kinase / FMN adenylyltransferase